jgi:hypothetical protein
VIIIIDIVTGKMTGAIHGMGTKNRRSVVNKEDGQRKII